MDNCSSNLLSQIHDDDTYYYYYYHVVRYSWVGSGVGGSLTRARVKQFSGVQFSADQNLQGLGFRV